MAPEKGFLQGRQNHDRFFVNLWKQVYAQILTVKAKI